MKDTKDSYKYANETSSKSKDVHIGSISIEGKNIIRPSMYSTKRGLSSSTSRYGLNGQHISSEYDLYEIAQAENVDSYMKRSVKIKSANMFKSSYEFVGKNLEVRKYILKRIRELELAGNYPFKLLMKDTGRDLIRYSNAFLVKIRNKNNSSGKRREITTPRGKTTISPVSAYFRVPAETIRIETEGQEGTIKRYWQIMPDGRQKKWAPQDVIHIYFDKKAGYNMGSPVVWPALDDLRALRRMEENMEFLVHYFIFPFFVVYVGTDEKPPEEYEDGSTEIDVVSAKINSMPSEGGMVLSYRHKVDVVGFDNIIPIDTYIEHFKKRVFAGLGVSSIDMGEGGTSNRNTADSLTRQMIDDVKDYQDVFSELINFELITELLLESPWGAKALSYDNMVSFSFNEIDIDTKIKLENHYGLMYEMNAITEDEMRKGMNREVLSDSDREGLYLNKVQKVQTELDGQIAMKTQAAKPSTISTPNPSAKIKQQPKNQHGTKSGPEKAKSSIGEEILVFLRQNHAAGDDLSMAELNKSICSLDQISKNPFISSRLDLIVDQVNPDLFSNKPQLAASILETLIESFISTHN